MTALARSALLAVLGLAAALVAVPATASAPPAAPATATAQAAPATTERPRTGVCRRITWQDASRASDNSAPVSCGSAHTTRTIGVLSLRGQVDWNSEATALRGSRYCFGRTVRFLGVKQARLDRSAYLYLYFYPTRSQRAAGARWIRCDLALKGGTASLQNLPDRPARTVASLPYAARYSRCIAKGIRAACTYRHGYRAVGTSLVQARSYPSREVFVRRARAVCPRQTGVRDWYASWPTEFSWKVGFRVLLCYR